MLNVNAFVLLCLELNSRRVDSAETNNFIVWPNDDIRTVTMSTENYGLAVACFQVYYASYGITKYTQCNISHAYTGVEIKPNVPLAWGMSSPEKLLVPKKNH